MRRAAPTHWRTARMVFAALALGLAACGGGEGPGEMHVANAWVAPNPAGSGPAGGYFLLHNGTSAERSLVAVESAAADRVELHRSWLEGDVARMGRVESVAVAPDAHVTFEPGGYHLMLFGLEPSGDSVPLQLRFDDGSERTVEADLRAAAGGDPHEHHDH